MDKRDRLNVGPLGPDRARGLAAAMLAMSGHFGVAARSIVEFSRAIDRFPRDRVPPLIHSPNAMTDRRAILKGKKAAAMAMRGKA